MSGLAKAKMVKILKKAGNMWRMVLQKSFGKGTKSL